MTASPQRVLWLVAGGLLAATFTLWGGLLLLGSTVGSVSRSEHHVLRGNVREVRIDGSAGDVTLLPSSGREVVVDAHAKGTLWMPKLDTAIDGGHVTVRGGCGVVVFGSCSVSFVVHVPEGTPVSIRTTSGDVTASGLSGPVDLEASSGDVELESLTGGTDARVSSGDIDAHRLGGRVALESTSGDVSGTDLTASVVSARASSGDVDIDVASPPRRVSASASSGDVTISVPRGNGERYDARVDTSSGDPALGIPDDPLAGRSLSAVTSSGDAAIRYRGG